MQDLGKKRFILVSEFDEVNTFLFYKKRNFIHVYFNYREFFNLTLMPCSLSPGHQT